MSDEQKGQAFVGEWSKLPLEVKVNMLVGVLPNLQKTPYGIEDKSSNHTLIKCDICGKHQWQMSNYLWICDKFKCYNCRKSNKLDNELDNELGDDLTNQ